MDFKYCKLEIFIPETHLPVLQKTLQEVDAGHIGNYDSCMSSSEVIGYWRPLEGCNPYIGNEGAIKKVHPYEEPVINAIPILRTSF